MIVEVTRLFDRWLKHSTYGVSAMLDAVPRKTPEDDEDPRPDDPWICNDTEDVSVAEKIDPVHVPALVLFAMTGSIDAQNTNRRMGQRNVVVNVAYVTRETPKLKAVRDSAYVLRAVMDSLDAYNGYRDSQDYRELNGVRVLAIERISEERVAASIGESELWGFIEAQISVLVG